MENRISIIWSPQANFDLITTLDYLKAHWNPKVAQRMLHSIERKLALLQSFPAIGKLVDTPEGCRKVFVPPYHLLLYRAQKEHIEVVRFFDGRQNPQLLK